MEGKKGNKSSSSHAIVLPAKKRKLDENEGLKVKKVKANKDKNIVIHRQESAIIDSDVHMVQRGFKTRCRPFHLVEMIKTFSDDQIKAVKEIGFGGLLSLKVKRTATDMLSWLVDCFDHGSCMFTIDGKKDFVVTEFDVYDVFCLPCKTSKKVEEISRCANVINPDYDLKIIYFHRLRFRNVVLNSTIPLIQHWTDVDIRDRIRNEKFVQGFWCGILEFDTYPVSEKLQFEDGQVVCNQFKEAPVNQTSGKESVVYEGVRSNVKGVIQFELPASSMSNEEIRSIAIDVIGEVPRIGFEHVLSNGKSKCSLAMDVSLFGDKVTYVTEYMKSSNKDMKVLDAVVQELVDYCISDYHGFDLNEVLVSFGKPFEITRNEFLSLGAPAIAISSAIIDCWAMLLNENQKSSAHGPQKLYFGVSQSAFLLKVANTDSNTQDIDKLFDIWSRWLFIPCNDFDIANVELEEKLQFIDNMSYDTKYMSEVEKFSDVLSDMLSTFLDQRLPQSNDSVKNMIEYTLESPSVNWKSGKQKNNDSGIYTMVSMLYFDGADVFDCNVLKTVSTRRTLRAQIAATLVLSDMNIVRDEVLEKLSEFRLIRSQVAKDVFDGIKKKTKQGKKEKKV
uniref:Uncharacterized protein n=1 Tax=Chenopodium quinoa TaxID=63459 RepID=A0A803M2U1_CHEQI